MAGLTYEPATSPMIDTIMTTPSGKTLLQHGMSTGELDGEDLEELLRRHDETQRRIQEQNATTTEQRLAIAVAVRQEREARQQNAQTAAQRMRELAAKREQTNAANMEMERAQTLATEQETTTKDGRRILTLTHKQTTKSDEQHTFFTTLHPGDGKTFPETTSTIVCHYIGTLSNGEVFDSSRGKEKEFQAKLGTQSLIQGWEWALSKMSLGERIELSIAPSWAYAGHGVPGHIPPGATLTFDVQLLEIDYCRTTDPASVALNDQLQLVAKENNMAQWVDEMSLGSGQGSGSKKKNNKGGKGKGKSKKKKKKKR